MSRKDHNFPSVLEFFEGPAKMARRLGVTRQAVNQWEQQRAFPKLRCYQIHVLSNGRFRHDRLPIGCGENRGKSSTPRSTSTD